MHRTSCSPMREGMRRIRSQFNLSNLGPAEIFSLYEGGKQNLICKLNIETLP